jgi:hypothetical protein
MNQIDQLEIFLDVFIIVSLIAIAVYLTIDSVVALYLRCLLVPRSNLDAPIKTGSFENIIEDSCNIPTDNGDDDKKAGHGSADREVHASLGCEVDRRHRHR